MHAPGLSPLLLGRRNAGSFRTPPHRHTASPHHARALGVQNHHRTTFAQRILSRVTIHKQTTVVNGAHDSQHTQFGIVHAHTGVCTQGVEDTSSQAAAWEGSRGWKDQRTAPKHRVRLQEDVEHTESRGQAAWPGPKRPPRDSGSCPCSVETEGPPVSASHGQAQRALRPTCKPSLVLS